METHQAGHCYRWTCCWQVFYTHRSARYLLWGHWKWFSSFFSNVIYLKQFGPLPILPIPVENDGIQLTLTLLITPNTTDDLLCKTFFILWYIWKARNDNRLFKRKTWRPWQVHDAVSANMTTHLVALRDQAKNRDTQQSPVPTLNINTAGSSLNAGFQGSQQQQDAQGVTPQPMDRYKIWMLGLLEFGVLWTPPHYQINHFHNLDDHV